MNDSNMPGERPRLDKKKDRVSGGVLLLIVGGVLLAREMGVLFPEWLFTWPMILILFGLFTAIKLRFRNPGWIIPTFIGLVFLADQVMPGMNLKPFIFPVILITIGLIFIFRPKRSTWANCSSRNKNIEVYNHETNTAAEGFVADRSDFVDTTSVFGGIKKIVLSKNFQGGDITNFMGGSEINLSQADIHGRVHIDTTNVFGGTKLIVPPHWDVQSEVVAVFGGVDDKRKLNGTPLDPTKVLVLDGTCLFGGIEISSY